MKMFGFLKPVMFAAALLSQQNLAFGAPDDLEQLKRIVAVMHSEIQALKSSQIGLIESFAGSTVPNGYLPCDGRDLKKDAYPALFNKIGYTYGGAGDTFRLPDLRGQFLRGWSASGSPSPQAPDQNRALGSRQSFATSAADLQARTGLVSPVPVEAHDGNNWYGVNSGGHQWTTEAGTVGIPSVRSGGFANDGGGYPWGNATENLGHGQGRHLYFYIRGGSWSTTLSGSSETRPTNVAVQFIIRAQ
jgi:hypothetical protein